MKASKIPNGITPPSEILKDDDELVIQEESKNNPPAVCTRKETGLFLYYLMGESINAFNKGIKIVVDIEPILYESAFSLIALAVGCSKYWEPLLTVRNPQTNEPFYVRFSLYMFSKPTENEINVVFTPFREREDLLRDLNSLFTLPRTIYFIVTPRRPSMELTTALYRSNVVLECVKRTLQRLSPEKLKYLGRVPYDLLLFAPVDIVRAVASSWVPPPPANADYLREKPRELNKLVIAKELRGLLDHYLEVIKSEGKGSMLFIGLPGSGRKTIAMSIAKELNYPAYTISIANILSRYVGESEEKLRAFFESMRARGGLAVFDGIDNLFKKSGAEQVSANLRSIVFQEMARDDNNFVIVFTANEKVPPEVLNTPLLGELKLVIPLPNRSERRTLTRLFLREIAGDNWDTLLAVVKESNPNYVGKEEKILEMLYAEPFVDATVGFTAGEIYQVMRAVLIPTIPKILSRRQLVSISGVVEEFTRRDYASRQAQIRQLIEKAISLGWVQIANRLVEVNEELGKLAREKIEEMEKYKA